MLVIMMMMMSRMIMMMMMRRITSGTSQASTTVEASLVDDSRPLATPQILLSVCLCICILSLYLYFPLCLYICLCICLYPLSFHISPTTPQILFYICLIGLIFVNFELDHCYLTGILSQVEELRAWSRGLATRIMQTGARSNHSTI